MKLQHRFVLRQQIGENVSRLPIRETIQIRDGGLGGSRHGRGYHRRRPGFTPVRN